VAGPGAVRYDAIVIGVGAMGAASCAFLARRGARVLGLDRYAIPNTMGTSHGATRVLRLCYYEHPDYVPLLRRGHELWHELNEGRGPANEPLLELTGGLYMGRPDDAFIGGTLEAARLHDLPHERLDHAALATRFPQFVVPDDHVGVLEPEAGLLRPERIIAAYAARARADGAELHADEAVRSWEADAGGVVVRTDRGSYTAAQLVICAGPWTAALAGELGVELTVSRQLFAWVRPRRPEPLRIGRLPIWGIDDPDGYFFYGFPMHPDEPGLKIARHHVGPPADPDTIDRSIAPEDETDVRLAVARHLPDARGPIESMAVCMYTNTPDAHFVIDRHPAHENVHVAAGFSGHGFKFASVVGEVMADLALRGGTAHPVGFLGLDRFRGLP
jgi:sarcosine oxidase